MFSRSAHVYDLIYHFKDYRAEVDRITERIRREHPAARTLLDVVCGTGGHTHLLAESFGTDGLDIEPAFVEIARGRLERGTIHVGDMADFDLDRHYDAILCLFSSIGYLLEWDRLVSALRCFGRHLHSDGLMLIAPWFTPDVWRVGSTHMQTGEGDGTKVCRMCVSEQHGSVSYMCFHYLVVTPAGVEHFTEEHRLALRTVDEMTAAFREAGLGVRYDSEGITGRGLYVARARR
jgi:SAM-dependent methyltransferase